MIRFTVTWTQNAQGLLADVWRTSIDRAAVARASDAIDRQLAEHPLGVGAVAAEGFLRFEIAPLAVLYSVQEPDRLVQVEYVRHL